MDEPQGETAATQDRRWLLVMAGFAGVGILIVAVMLGGGLIPGPAPTPEPSPSLQSGTPLPSAIATPDPSQAGPIEVAWEPVTGLDPTAQVSGLTFADGRWFALGGVQRSLDAYDAAIWVSDEGRTWTRAEIDAPERENEYSVVNALAKIGDALVAIGSWGALQSDQAAWVTWRSADGGNTWNEDRDNGAFFGALRAIAPGGPGLVAFGSNAAGVTPFDSLATGSVDGIVWETDGATLANASVADLEPLGDRIVGVGLAWTEAPEDSGSLPAAWYSDDGGETWNNGDVADAADGEFIFDVASYSGGLAAIGYGATGVLAWITTDGTAWERIDVAPSAQSFALGAVGGGLVAVGNLTNSDGSIGPGATWTSSDPRSWMDGSGLGDGSVLVRAAAGNVDVVLAGGRCQATSCETVLWRGEVAR